MQKSTMALVCDRNIVGNKGLKSLIFAITLILALLTTVAKAQITVNVTNPGNTTPALQASYTSFASALTDLNAVTAMSGPVTLTLNGGNSETTPATGLIIGSASLNPVLSSTNTVTINVSTGTATLNAGVGTATPGSAAPDGMLSIRGADYITIDGLTLTDGNTTNPASMEFGIGLFKLGVGDGATNNTIKNCIVNMQRVNNATGTAPMFDGSVGILLINATATAATTVLTPTNGGTQVTNGTNSNNKFYSNTINSSNTGIGLSGYAASSGGPAPNAATFLGDINNDIGGAGAPSATTGNIILNFGGAAAATNPAAGIRANNQWSLNISNNNINNNDGAGVNHVTTMRGIYGQAGTSANVTITYNTISIKAAGTTTSAYGIDNAIGSTASSNTVNINNNTVQNSTFTTATTGSLFCINSSATAATVNMNNNTVTGNSIGASGTASSATLYGVYNQASNGTNAFNANNNTITNNSMLNSFGSIYCIRGSTSSVTVDGNTISNISIPNNTGSTSSLVYGYYDVASPVAETITNNNINNLTISGANTSTSNTIYGISNVTAAGTKTFSGNNINNLIFTSSGAGSASVIGIRNAYGATSNIFKNVVHTLSSTGTTPTVAGIHIGVTTATTINVYNNLIGNLATPASTGHNLYGIFGGANGTTYNIYYNTVYINTTSTGTGFASSAMYMSSTTPVTTLRNNILINLSTATGTGLTSVIRRTAATFTAYGSASNNNLLYAGIPSASNVIYYNGTAAFGTNTSAFGPAATAGTFQNHVAPRESFSFNETVSTTPGVFFQSFTGPATGTSTTFLHMVNGLVTLVESGGAPIGGYTDDYDGNTRNAGTPDVGADEFTGTSAAPTIILNSVTPAATPLCVATARAISVDVTTPSGTITSVTLNYAYNGAAQSPITMSNAGGNTWTGTIPAATPTNATVSWTITALASTSLSATYTGTTYADDPLLTAPVVATATPGSVCSGSPTILNVTFPQPGTAIIGAGASTSVTGTGVPAQISPFLHYYGSAKSQYLIPASELTAAGMAGGNLTSLGINVVAADGIALTGLTISVAHTALAAQPATLITGLSQVYTGTYTPVTGLNTFNFQAPFSWNGTSNIIIQFCWGNSNTGNGSSAYTVLYDATAYVSSAFYRTDNSDPSTSCASTTGTSTGTNSGRPKFTFGASIAQAPATASWSDGSTIVGTTNPLTVNPTTNTSYTATITYQGCTKASNTVLVTVNALPPSPNANNSTQCGTAVPGAFVTTGGGGGGFNWYSAQTGGTLLQTGGATYTSSISSTTHFWVSESNGTCESPRIEVIASVNPPDAVSASSNGPVCTNSGLTLTATVTENTNDNEYAFTWTASPAAGSGIPTSQPGGTGTFGTPSSTFITPTTAGTYTYTVSGVDGDCTAQSTVIVTITALPQITSTTATPSTICAGQSTTLQATSGTIGTGPVTIGAGAITVSGTTTGQGNPYNHYYGGQKTQVIYTKAELNAAGITAGNISSLAFYISTLGSTTLTMNGFTINMGHTTQSTGTSTLITSGLTQVYSNASQGVTTGANTYSFSTPFNWNNTDNIVVSVCWSNVNSGSATSSAVLIADVTAATQVSYIWADATSEAALFAASSNASAGVGTTSQTNTTTNRPKITFTATTGVDNSASMNWVWNPGNMVGSTQLVNPSFTTTYTVTATDPSTTCINTAMVTVTVNQLPPAPSGANGTDQCGTAITDASVSSNNVTDPQTPPYFIWYDAPTGGVIKQQGTSTTYTTPVSATTTWYVAEVSVNGCEGSRVEITTIVANPDPLTVNVTENTICLGQSTDISSTYTPDFNSFATFDLTATGGAASGVTGTVSLTPNATGSDPYTITPTAAGTYTYTITAVDPDKGCTSVNTVTVTVSPLPVITTASASPTTVCAGDPVTLTATSIGASGTATVGAGATTTSVYNAPFYSAWSNKHMQILFTASELSAAGLIAGNITTVSFPTTSGTVANLDYSLKMGLTSATNVSSFISTTFTTVYTAASQPQTANTNNTITLTTPFAWDGVSNLVVNICFGNNASTATLSSTSPADATSYVSVREEHNLASTSGTTICGTTGSTTNSYSVRPKVLFGYLQSLTANYNWTWNPGNISAGTTGTTTVNPTTTTVYTATATDPATGCSAESNPVTVTVNPLPAAPSTNDPVTRCGPGSVTLTATGSGGPLKWYNVATGGTSLFTGGSYTTNVTTNTSFWVSETSEAGCTGPRTEVHVTVTAPPTLAITPGGATTFCQGGNVTLNGATGSDPSYINFNWSASPAAGSGLSSATGSAITVTPTAAGTYTITLTADDGQTNGCANATTITVTVNPNPVITSATATPATICEGGTSNLLAQTSVVGSGNKTLGAGATTSSTYDGIFYHLFGGVKTQFLVKASELTTIGIFPGNITALGINMSTVTAMSYDAFTVSIAPTAQTAMTTTLVSTGFTQVFTNASYSPVTGVNTFAFGTGAGSSSSFNWDGTSNIIVQFCWSNNTSGGQSNFAKTDAPGFTACAYYRADSQTPATLCPQTSGTSTTSSRPQFIFTGQTQTTGAGTYNWTWNPGSLNGNSVNVSPATTTSYTVTASDAVTGCSTTSSPVTVSVLPVGADATATPSTPVCAGTSVTLNAGATGGVPFTYAWTDGTATVYPATSSISVTPATTTTYTVTVTDACSNSITSSVTVTVNPLPTASIQEGPGPISICSPATQVLTAVTDAGAASYQWTLNGTNIPGATTATYTITTVGTGTYRVIVTNTATNCVSAPSTGVVVTINAKPSAVSITPPSATICNGSSVGLTASGGTIGSAGNATIGAGATTLAGFVATGNEGYGNPYNYWYGNQKSQYIYTQAELNAAGITAGNITSLSFENTAIGAAYSMTGFTISIAHTAQAAATTTPITTGFTQVYTNASQPVTAGVNLYTFTAPFVWNGTSNIVVSTCWGNSNSGVTASTATVKADVAPFTSTMIMYQDGAIGTGICAATTAINTKTTANRPKIVFGYSAVISTTFTWAPGTELNTTNGASVTASPSVTRTYTATATSVAGCTNEASVTVTVNPRPTATISGSGAYCQGQNTSTDLTVSFTGTAPWNYTYTDGTTPVSGTTSSNPLTITVAPSNSTPGVTTYTLTALSDANCASIAADLSGSGTVTVNPLAANPTATVTQPTCAVGTATITMTSPLGAGNSYTLDGTTTISWPTVSFTGVTPGPHTITVSNSFGCSAPASASVTVDPQPFTPTAPVITGTVNVCPFIGTGTQVTYHATATGNGTQVFNWVIPTTNVTIVSGQGTADLVLTFQNGFAAQANKQLRLTVTNQCGTSSMTIYYLLAQFPNTPNPITGPTNVCALIGTATTATYTTNKAAGALTYNWSTPANTVVSHPNGAGTNDTTIVVTFNTGFTGGNISVVAENLCGPSGTRTLTIVNTPPSTPGLISGPTNGCPHVAPGGTAATYSIALVPFATSYNWTVTPATAVVTHPNGAGANDNTITVVFPAGFTSGTVTVSATNGCGTGGVRSLSVTKLNPATPSVIDVIQTHFCGEAGGRKYTYTLASMPANATSVLWTVPAGATFINLSAISIEVTYPDVAVNGFVTAQATSNCAVSTIRSTTVKLPACPPPGFAAGKGETINPGPITKAMEVKIFPNPTVSDFKLQVLTSGSEEITIRVMDNLGRVYKSFKMMPYQTIALGAELKAGSYMIEVRQGSEVKTSKLIKF